jgi:hypothetical protein
MKIVWLLRGRDWRTFHVHRCLECGRKFCDDEPGSWTDYRYDEFPRAVQPLQLRPAPAQPHVAALPVRGAVLPRLRCQGRA